MFKNVLLKIVIFPKRLTFSVRDGNDRQGLNIQLNIFTYDLIDWFNIVKSRPKKWFSSFKSLKFSLSKVGFYISGKGDKKSWIETSGDDYLLSVCADRSSGTVCGEYTFQVSNFFLFLQKSCNCLLIYYNRKQR